MDSFSGSDDRAAFFNGTLYLENRFLDDRIAGSFGRDFQTVENRNAARNQGRHGAREPGYSNLAHQRTEDRQLQHDSINSVTPFGVR